MDQQIRPPALLLMLYTVLLRGLIAAMVVVLAPGAAGAVPNGTWLSKPQIWFHTSTNTLGQVIAKIKAQRYKVVFLDYRHVPDQVQQQVAHQVRQQNLIPVVWVQSPQYRSLTVPQLVHEARHGDGIQVDDHFFTHYSRKDFVALRSQYKKQIFCSIQPFQVSQVPPAGCDQLDVQCYTPQRFKSCMNLADRLKAVMSLSSKNTLKYQQQLGTRSFNVFLWPNSNEFRVGQGKATSLIKP